MEYKKSKPQSRPRSSTSEILGLNQARRVPQRWADHYETLTRLRERLRGDRMERGIEARENVSIFSEHMADAATDSYDRDWSLAMASSNQALLYEIDEAVSRIFTGQYGICEVTGEAIEAERLRAIPWTRYSTVAQAALEERGATRRTQLGSLGTIYSGGGGEAVDQEEEEETAVAGKK